MNLLLNSENVCFVNNNASSLFITQYSKEYKDIDSVIISRGEIIEIGGSYRFPEIIAETGLKLQKLVQQIKRIRKIMRKL